MNNKTNKIVLLAGASGLIGSHILDLLIQENRYSKIYVLTRRTLSIETGKVRQIITGFDQLQEALSGIAVDDVYCCLGTTMNKAGSKEAFRKVDLDYVVSLAQILKNNGARQFLMVSSMGANASSAIFYSRVKGEAENELKKIGFSGLHIFRPSLLLGERKESRMGEDLAKQIYRITSFLYKGPLKKFKAIESSVVARAMITIGLQDQDGLFIYESENIKSIC